MQTALKPKQFYLDRIIAHENADEVVRGKTWDGTKGCSIGCTLNDYSHSAYAAAGIGPEWLAKVQDVLFEGMSETKSRTWTSNIVLAIPDRLHGNINHPDWDKVKAQFLIVTLKSALKSFDHAKFPDVKAAIDGSIALWQRSDIGSPEFLAAARAAAEAARAAWAAAAAWAAEAAWAARAARAARAAAEAAWAAWAAARAAAEAAEATYDHLADELLRILKEVGSE